MRTWSTRAGLLTGLTKDDTGTTLEAVMTENLRVTGYEPTGSNARIPGTGTRTKMALTGIGPLQVEALRDRDGSFDPVFV